MGGSFATKNRPTFIPYSNLSPYLKSSVYLLLFFSSSPPPPRTARVTYSPCVFRFPETVTVSQTVFVCVDLDSVDLGSFEKFWAGLCRVLTCRHFSVSLSIRWGLWDCRRRIRGEVSFSSPPIKGTYCQHVTIKVDIVAHLAEGGYVRFSTGISVSSSPPLLHFPVFVGRKSLCITRTYKSGECML